jgi:hypothetical protein
VVESFSSRNPILRADGSVAFETREDAGFDPRAIAPHGVLGGLAGLVSSSSPDASDHRPGEPITLWTQWVIQRASSASRLKSFTHVLDGQRRLIAGDDRSDFNFTTLQPGDQIRQYSFVTLPSHLAPGNYTVEVGWYDPDTGIRLTLPDGSDHIVLPDPLQVSAP